MLANLLTRLHFLDETKFDAVVVVVVGILLPLSSIQREVLHADLGYSTVSLFPLVASTFVYDVILSHWYSFICMCNQMVTSGQLKAWEVIRI